MGLLGIPASTWAWDAALAMIPLGVFGTGIAFVLMAMLAGRVGGSRASIATYFVPLVAIIALLGATLVLVGAWIASRREGRGSVGSIAGSLPLGETIRMVTDALVQKRSLWQAGSKGQDMPSYRPV